MAPVAPKKTSTTPAPGAKRLTARQKTSLRLANPLIPRKVHRADAVVSESFINSKRDKRLIKHSSFISRISKSSAPASKLKRRRPNKKLVTTLESLGDALDDITNDLAQDGNGLMDKEQAAMGKIRHKSLKSRPGALKRKEKVVKGEMERFGRSLAQLSTMGVSTNAPVEGGQQTQSMEVEEAKSEAAPTATASRWAALRGFINATMEQNPAFLQKKEGEQV